MGGWSDQPYIYPTCTPLSERKTAYPYSSFNPRASTQAAYQAIYDQNRPKPQQNGPLLRFDQPSNPYMVTSGNGDVHYTPAAYEALQAKKKTKPEGKGPLINFNQHPDSWRVVNAQSVKYKPMPANTKKKVTILRWIQFALRILEEAGALGTLIMLICFTNMPTTFSWIMRIAPAWDVFVTLYAIYHLIRPARARTPASSASYHIFALCNDIGLLPFYVYICLASNNNYTATTGLKDRWHSLFSDADITTKLLLGSFISTAVMSGLHLFSVIMDLWLIILFRNIAKLPPDVNPLEDNLTSRASRRIKHKYKNSEAPLTGSFESFDEKKPAYLSGSTLSVDQPSHLSRDFDQQSSRKIEWTQTRARTERNVYVQKPDSARASREAFEETPLYKNTESARDSTVEFDSPSKTFDRELTDHVTTPAAKELSPWPPQFRERDSRPSSSRNLEKQSSFVGLPVPTTSPFRINEKSHSKSNLLGDNWYVFEDDSDTGSLRRSPSPAIDYPEVKESNVYAEPQEAYPEPQPLKMNPPTPPLTQSEYSDPDPETERYQVVRRKPLTSRMDNGNGQAVAPVSACYVEDSSYLSSQMRPGQPKGKYYGDLAAATRGVLGKAKPTTGVSRINSFERGKPDTISNGPVNESALGSFPSSLMSQAKREGNARVISRSGVDVVDYAGRDAGFGLRDRRDVSGKVAEEGRGGSWWSGCRD